MKIKKSFLYVSFCFFIVIQQLHAMHKDVVQVTDISDITSPCAVSFCGNKMIAVLEPQSFTVRNRKMEHIVIQKDQVNMFDLAVSKDGKKVALFSDKNLTVYDPCTGKLEWQQDIGYSHFFPIAFNSQDSSQVLLYDKQFGILRVYSSESMEPKGVIDGPLDANCLFAHHPHKTEIIYGISDQGYYYCTNYGIGGIQSVERSESLWCSGSFIVGQEYCCDGSYITVVQRGHTTHVVFVNFKNESNNQCVWAKNPIVAMAFHPNNKIVFLLDQNNCLQCWNFLKKELKRICDVSFSGLENIPLKATLEKRLAVSPDGKRLCIAFKDKCSIMRLPFDVVYGLQAKEQLFSIMSLLKLYEVYSCDESGKNNIADLPKDIIYVIVKKFLKLFRYSFIS